MTPPTSREGLLALLNIEETYLLEHFGSECDIMPGDVEGSFHRILREKSDLEVARFINLALLMKDGISEQHAGFDTVTSLNDAGIAAVARVVTALRTPPGIDARTVGEIRTVAADAIRTFCQSLGAHVAKSDGVERIYYSGLSLDALSLAVAMAVSRPHRGVGE